MESAPKEPFFFPNNKRENLYTSIRTGQACTARIVEDRKGTWIARLKFEHS